MDKLVKNGSAQFVYELLAPPYRKKYQKNIWGGNFWKQFPKMSQPLFIFAKQMLHVTSLQVMLH